MHQFSDPQVLSQQYEAQIRARMLEGSFALGVPAKSRFRGRLEISGLTSLPEQDFSFHSTKNGSYIENHPKDHWPSVRIDFNDNSFEAGNLQIASIDNTVEAGVLVTRLLYTLFSADKC